MQLVKYAGIQSDLDGKVKITASLESAEQNFRVCKTSIFTLAPSKS